jgi:anti-sigma-K factor RskA
MGAEGERVKRAADYVSGLMNETERARAERDLEFDPAFRDAVLRLADEMRLFDRTEIPGSGQERWEGVARRIAELPQMRAAGMENLSRRRIVGMDLHALPGRRTIVVAFGLIAAFMLGYLTAKLL